MQEAMTHDSETMTNASRPVMCAGGSVLRRFWRFSSAKTAQTASDVSEQASRTCASGQWQIAAHRAAASMEPATMAPMRARTKMTMRLFMA